MPIFINGVEAHTVVRDLLTTEHEQARRAAGVEEIDSLLPDAAVVDAVVSTVGFPLVGGPAGSMEAGRQAEVVDHEPPLSLRRGVWCAWCDNSCLLCVMSWGEINTK